MRAAQRGEALRHGPARQRAGRVAPLGENLVARRGGERRQRREAQVRIGRRRRGLEQEQLAQALGGGGIEQVGVVLQRAGQARGVVEQRQQQIVAGVAVVGVDRLEA